MTAKSDDQPKSRDQPLASGMDAYLPAPIPRAGLTMEISVTA